jgi:DNA-binding response OmpR family regulator
MGETTQHSILLVEDDREIATTIQTVLEAKGYRVRHAINGIDARAKVEEELPELVITDMMMPQLGGFPTLDFLRQLPQPPRMIMITANEGGRHKAFAELMGVDDYIRKPFPMEVLVESVQRSLDKVKPEDPQPAKPKRGRKTAAE